MSAVSTWIVPNPRPFTRNNGIFARFTTSYVGYYDSPFFDRKKFALPGTDQLTILVLDEIKKADDQLFKVLMPVLDEGKIQQQRRDYLVHKHNYHCNEQCGIRKMSKQLKPSLGFAHAGTDIPDHATEIELAARKGLENRFSHLPEFIARFNDIVVFQPHSENSLRQILDQVIDHKNENLRKRLGVEILLSDGTKAIPP